MSSGLSRRDFLRRTAVTGAGVMIIGASEVLLSAPNGFAAPRAIGYGTLQPGPPPGAARGLPLHDRHRGRQDGAGLW
ncbi:MAG: twin-arginine translocation signal domain-containing protein [Pseudonocardiaceae bacterium]